MVKRYATYFMLALALLGSADQAKARFLNRVKLLRKNGGGGQAKTRKKKELAPSIRLAKDSAGDVYVLLKKISRGSLAGGLGVPHVAKNDGKAGIIRVTYVALEGDTLVWKKIGTLGSGYFSYDFDDKGTEVYKTLCSGKKSKAILCKIFDPFCVEVSGKECDLYTFLTMDATEPGPQSSSYWRLGAAAVATAAVVVGCWWWLSRSR
ncbi:MAG: hypothetical protein M1549_03175 [Candidatus Dependentiae bacterium]|nr:hypothetical protein [Candidatus Dependentiae bacterium]